jgi:glycosyltransferase involved in cell wall biosynthesis
MKIAFLNIYNGVIDRGSEVFVKELASRLSKHHEVTVFQTGKKTCESYNVIQIDNIPKLFHQGFGNFNICYDFSVILFTLKCIKYLSKNKYDWVIPINGRWQVVMVRALRRFYKFRILISGHAGIGFEDGWNIYIGNPDIFVALSPKAFKWATKFLPKSKLKYISNGVDTNKFSPKSKPESLKLKKPVILCVSALIKYKQVESVIKAVAVKRNVSLLVIGDGVLRNNIKKLGEKLLGSRFQLILHVDNNKMPSFYNACDLFTLPSFETEAFGIVYLEAMACNLPVVAPDDENRKTIIGNAGLFCNTVNITEYANTIKYALNTSFGNKPRKQAENFTWEFVYKQYNNLFISS